MKIRTITHRVHAASWVFAMALIAVAFPFGIVGASAQGADIATRVQFVHAGTDLGEVEIFLNETEELDEFAYGEVSDWIDVDPGSLRVTITKDEAGFNTAVFDSAYPVPAGNDYFVVITDALILSASFDTSSVTLQGSRAQIVHASVDTPPVTVTASGNAVALATELHFAGTSAPAPLPSGTYDLEVALADTGEVVLTKPGVVIDPDRSYALVLVGDPLDSDKPLDVIVLQTELQEPPSTPVS
ncbi:MAG TPA: DUF4397 domain-containing protein [Thermomicrobiales bacterium]|nr:DUF4397 domain-containing protein [Thermomicrobiales bacterium]